MEQKRQADKTSFEWLIQQNNPQNIHRELSDTRQITFTFNNSTILIELVDYLFEQYKTQRHAQTITNQNMPTQLKLVYENTKALFDKCLCKKQAYEIQENKIIIKCPVFEQEHQITRQVSLYLQKVPELSKQEQMKKIVNHLLQKNKQKNIISSFQQQIPLSLLSHEQPKMQKDKHLNLSASYHYQNKNKYADVLTFITRMFITGMLVSSIMFSFIPFLIEKNQLNPYFIYSLCLAYCGFVMFLIILFYISTSDKLKIGVVIVIGSSLIGMYALNVKRLGLGNISFVEISTILAILFSWTLMIVEKTAQYMVKRVHGNIRKSKNKMMRKLSQSIRYGNQDDKNKKTQ